MEGRPCEDLHGGDPAFSWHSTPIKKPPVKRSANGLAICSRNYHENNEASKAKESAANESKEASKEISGGGEQSAGDVSIELINDSFSSDTQEHHANHNISEISIELVSDSSFDNQDHHVNHNISEVSIELVSDDSFDEQDNGWPHLLSPEKQDTSEKVGGEPLLWLPTNTQDHHVNHNTSEVSIELISDNSFEMDEINDLCPLTAENKEEAVAVINDEQDNGWPHLLSPEKQDTTEKVGGEPLPSLPISSTDHQQNKETCPQQSASKARGQTRDDATILWQLSQQCCKEQCNRKLSVDDIAKCDQRMSQLTQTGRRNYILDYVSSHTEVLADGSFSTEFVIKGKVVCQKAWLLAQNVNKETFRRLTNKFKNGTCVVEHGNKRKSKPRQKSKECIAWLEFFISCVGQHQPDKKSIHLPSCFTILSIYRQMVAENEEFGVPSVSSSTFYSIFHVHFPTVSIPKENRFTKCTDCTKYKAEKEKTLDKKKHQEIDALLKEHIELVWQERRVYYLHRYKARRYPDKYITIIDDGMDQKTTAVPKVIRESKATCHLATLGTHLVGAIFHSGQVPAGKEVYGSFDFYQWKHDPNLTASVLLKMLGMWCETHKLPPVLYLQLDNCVKENKNQFMMWLLAVIVELKIVEKVRMNFLPVGHTHEDIDALFGVYSKYLDKNNVYTVEELLRALSNCMTSVKVVPFLLKEVYNIKDWLEPHAFELHQHTAPKCFKFIRNEDSQCVMFYRNYSHMEWEGPLRILKDVPVATDKPALVEPTLDKVDVQALRTDNPKFKEHYPAGVADTWKAWIDSVPTSILQLPADWQWPLEMLLACEKTRPSAANIAVPENLVALRDKETQETRQIYTGRYRPVRERQNPVEVVDNCLENLEENKFAAVYLEDWDREPVIGKVVKDNGDTFTLHYWKGTYNGKWAPQNAPRTRTPWVDSLPKTCIIVCAFELTEDMKLLHTTRNHLKSEYARLKDRS